MNQNPVFKVLKTIVFCCMTFSSIGQNRNFTVIDWDDNTNHQLFLPYTYDNVSDLSSGYLHGFIIQDDMRGSGKQY